MQSLASHSSKYHFIWLFEDFIENFPLGDLEWEHNQTLRGLTTTSSLVKSIFLHMLEIENKKTKKKNKRKKKKQIKKEQAEQVKEMKEGKEGKEEKEK